ncbi:winged helix-turn-helix transcriptional regulator [Streptomyces yangpuensis]|uniref:winged helix-turn-helix transcriptional regulator n=1 Tax=Streptomyces yangpuensis TaxID=1648182 RepID=UPI00062923C6|nr:helix-turn-helix domain-containing protein [Streptomyces yangpuensis]
MVTKQFTGSPDDADLRRADSLAREIFSDVANKWALLIIEALGGRVLRFSELRDEVEGISHKMLTQNLRMLEHNGLIERTVYPVVPPRVEYALTEPGQALRVTIDALCDWTHRHLGQIEAARRRTDAAAADSPDTER